MTVGQLLAKLKDLPEDMEIQVLDSESMGPVDIVTVSRGSWSDDTSDLTDDELNDWEPSDEEPEFNQDDETGKIAVIIFW